MPSSPSDRTSTSLIPCTELTSLSATSWRCSWRGAGVDGSAVFLRRRACQRAPECEVSRDTEISHTRWACRAMATSAKSPAEHRCLQVPMLDDAGTQRDAAPHACAYHHYGVAAAAARRTAFGAAVAAARSRRRPTARPPTSPSRRGSACATTRPRSATPLCTPTDTTPTESPPRWRVERRPRAASRRLGAGSGHGGLEP